jgi:hypothetical protein
MEERNMDGERNGLTLQGLAQRLEALTERLETQERENEQMRSENAELRHEVAVLRGSGTREAVESAPALEEEGRVSRRALLTKAGAAAVAGVAAGAFLNPREARADTFDQVISESDVFATTFVSAGRGVFALHNDDSNSAVWGRNRGFGPGVQGEKQAGDGKGPAVEGLNKSTGGPGVKGEAGFNGPGVHGHGVIGVRGTASIDGQAGVYGEHDTFGPGVVGDGAGNNYAGVLGRNDTGTGVWGKAGQDGYSGVYGQHTGNGYGVVGDGAGNKADYAGVLGRFSGGTGVRGEGGLKGVHGKSKNIAVHGEADGTGWGVHGYSLNGYGGFFWGGKAPLRLMPANTAGAPTTGSHKKGEIYMDSKGALWVCAADGAPGTWQRIRTA